MSDIIINLQDHIDKVWVLSDLHFGHANILKFVPERYDFSGGDINVHDSRLIEMINEYVMEDDILINLGDIAMRSQYIVNCSKFNVKTHILIRGNHDLSSERRYLDAGITKIMPALRFNDILFSHFPVHPCELKKDINETPGWGRYIGNCHGHTHNNVIDDPRYFNACLDNNHILPIKLTTILEYYENIKQEVSN